MDSVAPIQSGGDLPPPRKSRAPKRKDKNYLYLRAFRDGEGFTTLDLINGLSGVCQAFDEFAVNDSCRDKEAVINLSMAAKVLADLVANRVEVL